MEQYCDMNVFAPMNVPGLLGPSENYHNLTGDIRSGQMIYTTICNGWGMPVHVSLMLIM